MRRIINIVSIVTLLCAAVSCTKSDRIYDKSRSEIAVDPVMAVMSKAIVTGTGYPDDVSFGVFASYSANPAGEWTSGTVQPYLENKEFIHIGESTYRGEQPAYWPFYGSLVFAGYSPYYQNPQDNDDVAAAFDAASKTLLIQNFLSDGQTDLMYFLPTLSLAGNYVGVFDENNAVPAQFHHALSLISFEIKADPLDDGRVTLKDLKINDANTSGNFSATCANSSANVQVSWNSQKQSTIDLQLTDSVIDSDTALAKEVLVVPGSNETNSTEIEITYDVVYNTLDGSGSVVSQRKEVQASFDVKDYTPTWEDGKKYVYGVTIGLNRIEFENLTAADWYNVK